VARREIPAGLRAPITGCLGELRAILDNLVWGLSQVVGEPASCGIDFPVFLTEVSPVPKLKTFETWARDNRAILSKFPTGAEALVRQLQPFNAYKESQAGTSHPIYILNKLINQDKHKMPLHIAGVHQKAGLFVDYLASKGPLSFPTGQALENNPIIIELTMPSSDSIQGFKPQAFIYIAFDKDSFATGAPVYEFLVNMHDFIRDEVVAKFEPFFS
jgi:hypothetical protein